MPINARSAQARHGESFFFTEKEKKSKMYSYVYAKGAYHFMGGC